MKKYLSLFLVLVMLLSSMPLSAIAESDVQEAVLAASEQEAQSKTLEEAAPAAEAAEEAVQEETEEKTEEKPEEKPVEVKAEEPVEEKTEEPVEEKTEEPVEEKTEEPVEEKTEEPVEEKTEEPVEEKTEEPVEEKTEETVPEEPQAPAEGTADDAVTEPEEPTEGAVDAEGTQEETVETPVEDTAQPEETEEPEVNVQQKAEAKSEELIERAVSAPAQPEAEGFSVTTVSATSVKVRWYEVPGCDGYEVQSSSTSGFESGTVKLATLTGSTSTTKTFTDLTCGQTRYYRVRAYVLDGDEKVRGPWSKVISYRTSPNAPSYLNAEAVSATSVKLSWPKVSEATGYIVTRDGTQIRKTTLNTSLSYTNTGLTLGSRYVYRVYSYKTVDGEDIVSAKYAEYVDPEDGKAGYTVVPPAPKDPSTTSAGLASIKVSWKQVDDVDGYNIYRSLATLENFKKWGTVSGEGTLSFIDSQDIATGDEYHYYVTSFVGGVESKPSATVIGKAVPNTPANVTAKYVNSTSIKVSWDEVSGARGYIVEGSNSKKTSYTILDVVEKTSYTETGLTVGQMRYYRVRAYVREYGSGEIQSANSLVVSEMTRPAAPTDLKLTNTAYNKIKVSFSRPAGADGYQVYRSTNGSSWGEPILTYDSTSASPFMTNTKLTCGTTYYYKVRAFVYGADGTRYPGPFSSVKSLQAKPPAPGTIAVVRVSGKNWYKITWGDVSGVDGYRVYMKTNGGDAKLMKDVNEDVNAVNITELKPGYTYQFYVRGYRMVNDNRVLGASKFSDKVVFPFDVPKNLKRTSVNLTSFKLSWDAIGGVDGYEVKVWSTDDATYEYEAFVKTNSATIKDVVAGYHYFCQVRAYSVLDGEKVYGPWCSTFTGYATPTAPKNPAARSLYGKIGTYLTWDKVSGASGYIIMRSTKSGSGYTQIAKLEGSNTTSYEDVQTSAELGNKYYYKIASYIDTIDTKISPYTGYVSVTTKLPRPTLTVKNAGLTKATLSWTAVSGADGYGIYRATSSTGTYKQIARVTASNTSHTAEGLTTGQKYYFRVAAYYKDSTGARAFGTRSQAQSVVPAPTAVTGLKGTAYAQSVKLSWTKKSGVSGYRVYRATATGSYKAIADVTGNSYTDTELTCGATYRYKVAAYKDVSGGKAVGSTSSAITKTTAVTKTKNLKYTVASASSVKLTWDKVRDADGYVVQLAKVADGEYKTLGTVTTNSRTISELPTGQYRYARVRAYVDQDGERVYCSQWSDVKKLCSKPMAVTNLTCTAKTKTSLTVNWTKTAGATGYKIYYKKPGASTYTLASAIKGGLTSYRITGLSSGTKYSIKVIATCEDSDNKTISSSKAAVLTATTK